MRKPLQTQGKLKGLLTAYYHRLAAREKPVAWCTSVGPAEALRAFGYEVYFPENHGALIGAKRAGARYIPAANREGYSPDICSYLSSDIGAYRMGETPLAAYGLEEVPKPDLLVYNTSQCREVKEWFDFYRRELDVPLLGINTPRNLDESSPWLLGYLRDSWAVLIQNLEEITGRALDRDHFAEVTALSHRACSLWQEFLESARGRPAPHTFFDHIFLMAPVVVLRGTAEAVTFYEELVAEVVAKGPVEETERHRIYWEGMPIWGKTRFLASFFHEHGASVAASTYCHSWAFDFEPKDDDPLEAMIDSYSRIFITQSQEAKLQYLKETCSRFEIDAVVFHDAKTCPHNTNSRFGIPQRLLAETDVPVLTFFGDLVDVRHFSEEEFGLRMEAFLEQLDDRKARRRRAAGG